MKACASCHVEDPNCVVAINNVDFSQIRGAHITNNFSVLKIDTNSLRKKKYCCCCCCLNFI
jgi:hypothetical protein